MSRIINDYVDCAKSKTECHSGEEMRAAFEAFNNLVHINELSAK